MPYTASGSDSCGFALQQLPWAHPATLESGAKEETAGANLGFFSCLAEGWGTGCHQNARSGGSIFRRALLCKVERRAARGCAQELVSALRCLLCSRLCCSSQQPTMQQDHRAGGRGSGRAWLPSTSQTDLLGPERYGLLTGVSGLHYKMHKQAQSTGFYPP